MQSVVPKILGRDSSVVEEAVSTEEVIARVVSRWPAKRESRFLAIEKQAGRSQGRVGGRPRRLVGVFAERRTGIHRVPSEQAVDMFDLNILTQAADGPDKGKGFARPPYGRPFFPEAFQKRNVFGSVDPVQRTTGNSSGATISPTLRSRTVLSTISARLGISTAGFSSPSDISCAGACASWVFEKTVFTSCPQVPCCLTQQR